MPVTTVPIDDLVVSTNSTWSSDKVESSITAAIFGKITSAQVGDVSTDFALLFEEGLA